MIFEAKPCIAEDVKKLAAFEKSGAKLFWNWARAVKAVRRSFKKEDSRLRRGVLCYERS
jgi:hypothetical protein